MMSRNKKKHARYLGQLTREINPDEIFLDAENLPGFDKDQFEGRIEQPIGKGSIFGIGIVFGLVLLVFLGQSFNLQVVHGQHYLARSENNRLDHAPLFATRGVIYDRNGEKLAWNTPPILTEETPEGSFPRRAYIQAPGFAHVLGYVNYPKKDSRGNYYQKEIIGKDGIEESYNHVLSGVNGVQISETDALGNVTHTGSVVQEPVEGSSLVLGIDARIETKFYEVIQSVVHDRNFLAGAGGIMDIETGELLALTAYPEYDMTVMSEGTDSKTIQSYQLDRRSVFLDRAVSGVYAPGSIVKPMMAAAALAEGVISPEKKILSTGSISIPNPYNPLLRTVFNDWKAHGWVDMRDAIAVSSDVYFYAIGGGFEDQAGIGIANINKYARMFGFGSLTGVDLEDERGGTIPSPEWKAETFPNDPVWRIGNTYHTIIGQYGFQTTLLQALRATAAVANGGTLLTPHLVVSPAPVLTQIPVGISDEHLKVAREGMRQGVQSGTVTGLNVGYVDVAGKTGTAEIDARKLYVNSWIVGFFPYENPKYAFAVVMERGPHDNTIGGVYVMRQMLDWMRTHTPEYILQK